jgi:hypothetical protein
MMKILNALSSITLKIRGRPIMLFIEEPSVKVPSYTLE